MENNPKIIFFSYADYRGGAEQIIISLVNHYKSGFVYCLNNRKGYEWPVNPANIHYDTSSNKLTAFLSILKNLKTINQYDICYSSQVFISGYLGLLKRLRILRVKTLVFRESTTIFSRFGSAKKLFYKLCYSLGYKAASLIICQSEQMKRELLHNIVFLRNYPVHVISNPINVSSIEKASTIVTPELAYVEKEKINIISAGRLIPEKGYEYLLRAISIVRSEYKLDIKLLIMGEGPLREKLERDIAILNLTEHVQLTGFVKNPFPLYKAGDICVVSSIKEGFPNSLLQMMLLNHKVVSTLCADGIENLPEIITCPIQDDRALAISLVRAIDFDPNYTHRVQWLKEHNSIDIFLNVIIGSQSVSIEHG